MELIENLNFKCRLKLFSRTFLNPSRVTFHEMKRILKTRTNNSSFNTREWRCGQESKRYFSSLEFIHFYDKLQLKPPLEKEKKKRKGGNFPSFDFSSFINSPIKTPPWLTRSSLNIIRETLSNLIALYINSNYDEPFPPIVLRKYQW